MNRYFVVDDADMPNVTDTVVGHWTSIDLGSHGTAGVGKHVVALSDDFIPAPASWVAMPRLVDPTTTMLAAGVSSYITDVGVTSTDTMYEAAQALGAILPVMGH